MNNFDDVLRHIFFHRSPSMMIHILSRPSLFSILCSIASIFALVLVRSLTRKANQSVKLPELSALRMIMTPTSSCWAPSTRKVVTRSQVSSQKTMWLSLDVLVHCIASGDLEFRCPSHDLPNLLHSSILVNGWDIRLCVHFTHRVYAVLWFILARFDVSCMRVPCGSC
ncbi:hypothetical protein BJV78DRAFT_858406 [Lactifluus subvellereus]|nr:hypothetical protein BJV78DRAFT_858406 [Lactifluus subvellereus]